MVQHLKIDDLLKRAHVADHGALNQVVAQPVSRLRAIETAWSLRSLQLVSAQRKGLFPA
jgi:hypothetical protein